MRKPLEIVAELKHVTNWSQPNIKFNETMALLNELEASLNTPEPVTTPVKEPVAETTEEPTPAKKPTKK